VMDLTDCDMPVEVATGTHIMLVHAAHDDILETDCEGRALRLSNSRLIGIPCESLSN
jgi:hypothetical protein